MTDEADFKAKMTEEELIDRGFTTWPRLFVDFFKESKVKDKIEFVAVGENLLTWRQALKNKQFIAWFDDGFGGVEGVPFTAWSKDWVYFPVCYDGAQWVLRVPRNPCTHITEHVGGG